MDRNYRIYCHALIILAVALWIVAGCSDKPTGTNGNVVRRYMIETEPTLSPDRQYVYFIATDTINEANSGIYRAQVGRPVRELVLADEGLHSPTIAPDNRTLAYLDGGRIVYYDISTGSTDTSSITRTYFSIQFADDSLFIAGSGQSVYVVNRLRGTDTVVATGWDPSPVPTDTFMYVVIVPGSAFAVVQGGIGSEDRDSVYYVSVFEDYGIMRWPSRDRGSGRFAWVHDDTRGEFHVHVGTQSPYVDREIAATTHEKALMISADLIIYTGPDGRLYQSNFAGTDIGPWWHAE